MLKGIEAGLGSTNKHTKVWGSGREFKVKDLIRAKGLGSRV